MQAPTITERLPPRDNDRDDRATIAVFASVVASVIAALYYAGRLGFDNPVRPVAVTLGLSLFITVTSFLFWRFSARGHYHEPQPWWRSQTALTIAAVVITALAGMLVPRTGLNLAPVLAAIGFVSAIVALVIWIRQGQQLANLIFLVGSAAFAVWACGVAWSTRYKTPVFWETLEYRADVHHDPLYQVATANNMRSYGVPSTGLDGVPYIPYHYGSAWLNSQWAWLAGTDVLSFYSLGPPVIVIPLFFAAILLLAVEVKKNWSVWPDLAERPLKTDYAAWLFFLAVSIGVIPTSGLDAMGIWNEHAMISESYVIAVPVFLLTIATAISWWRRKRTSLSSGDMVFLFLFAPLMLAAIGFLKVSLMLLLLCAGLGVAALGRMVRDRLVAASAILCLAASAGTYKLVSVAAQNQGLVPFAYMRFSVNAAWWPYFILVHLFWSWLYIYLRLREEKLESVGAIRGAALEGRITDVVLVAIVAIAGWLPGELIDIHGGSAVYFSDVQRWLAMSLLMASAWRLLAHWRQRRESVAPGGELVGSVRLSQLWIAALAIPISITIILNAVRAPGTAFRANIALRRALYTEAGVSGPVSLRALADRKILIMGRHRSPAFLLIAMLRELDNTPPALKRRTLLFIPQSYDHFWHLWREPERCSYIPFIAPATSGLALLDGMPPVDCDLTTQYGMTNYQRRTKPQLPVDVMPVTLCEKAKAKGFSRVVVLDSLAAMGIAVHIIECPVRIAAPVAPLRIAPPRGKGGKLGDR
jgi:hypothetical protein